MGESTRLKRAIIGGGIGALAAGSLLAGAGPAAAVVKPIPGVVGHVIAHFSGKQPPTSAQCLAQISIACYSPQQIEQHYDLGPLYNGGLTGAGRTIVIVDAFGSPTIQADLQAFDAAYGLPNPSLSIIQPAGAVPPWDPNNSDMVGWGVETSLDVEWSHSIAPGANILLVETPVSETEGVQGFPQIVEAENYVVAHHLGDVISQSFGATEETFPSAQSIYNLRSAFVNAHNAGITVLAASGDNGITDDYSDLSCCYAHPVNSWPSSDTLVTSVGGTEVVPGKNGNPEPLAADRVWQDYNKNIGGSPTDPTTCCAGGGGLSVVFSRPAYQDSVEGRVGLSRGTPDISMSASVKGAVNVYLSFAPYGPNWFAVGGTSEATPIFSGIVAIADQLAGRDMGLINDRLYALAQTANNGIVDVTKGNNGMTFPDAHNGNKITTVTGNHAGPGYDLASGLGTIDAAAFIPAFVKLQY